MDIAGYIQDLLWEYECVIIPGFGGILTTYRPAEIGAEDHSICPPSKSLAFNEYLTNNDGLLVNHICRKDQVSYPDASEQVTAWVKKTQNLLQQNEEIHLAKIGRFHKDMEKKLRFEPDTSVNYLPSAYGLRKIVAAPVPRTDAETEETESAVPEPSLVPHHTPFNKWAIAATVILFLSAGAAIGLIYQGVLTTPHHLNAASILGFLNFGKPNEIPPKTGPDSSAAKNLMARSARPVAQRDSISNFSKQTDSNNISASPTEKSGAGKKYYVIIGSFKKGHNFKNAQAWIRSKYPGEEIYLDTALGVKRIGFYAGDNYTVAQEKLKKAKQDKQEYWLLVKN